MRVSSITTVPLVHQEILVDQLKAVFPEEKSYTNARESSNFKTSSGFLEADVWFPNLHLCFEFQDAHHYATTWYNHISYEKIQQVDYRKRTLAQQQGVCLIEVPCWWDGSVGSLVATICFRRPDLMLESTEESIPLNPPHAYFLDQQIPEVGELMLASFPVDTSVSFTTDYNNWWIGEKYDGVRCCWIPSNNELYTRSGRSLQMIPELVHQIPNIVIDAEFWFGRGFYGDAFALSKGDPSYTNWPVMRIVAFDEASEEDRSFETRYNQLLLNIHDHHPFIQVAARKNITNDFHVHFFLHSIIGDGGEGAILRKVGSPYERGRSTFLIKLKKISGDKEAVVVELDKDQSIILQLPNGRTFSVARENILLLSLPRVGDIVSFSAESFSRRAEPMNPKVYRIRSDLLWEDVVGNTSLPSDNLQITGFTSQPLRHWTTANMRLFLENFAKIRKLDPLLAETWYNIPQEYLGHLKTGGAFLQKLGGHINALRILFPEINFDIGAFSRSSWGQVENRREFFEKYAKMNSFDFNIPENWYSQPVDKIMLAKGAPSVVQYHGGSVTQALLDLFPDIGLVRSKLWMTFKERRTFFETYAKSRNFDPLDPDCWYTQSRANILSEGMFMISKHYHGSVRNALLDVFPSIGFIKSKFWPRSIWRDPKNRRKFFENFANENKFDPLVAENWYSQSSEKLKAIKGVDGVLLFHESVLHAVIDLFPDIGLDKSRLWKPTLKNASARRKFFEEYAHASKFDPLNPENWYSQPLEKIMASKGAHEVLSYHDNNLVQSLHDLFPDVAFDACRFLTQSVQHIASTQATRREFFLHYAAKYHFDPNVPENWYAQPTSRILAEKGAMRVMAFHRHSIPRALIDLFPTLVFDVRLFNQNGSVKWKSSKTRKKFFEDYAKLKGFDPTNAEHWYLQAIESIMNMPGAYLVMSYHNNTVSQALLQLFPDIGLHAENFSSQTGGWHSAELRRSFFMQYALVNAFNPHDPLCWYQQPRHSIMATKGASRVIHYHNHSVSQALVDLFPDIGLDKSKFWKKGSWHDKDRRRKFFEDYAKENNFDPNIAENWYSQPLDKITSQKGAASVLAHHNKSVGQALYQLFPDIGLERSRLWPHMSWRTVAKRRQFFEAFALENGFDTSDTAAWYHIPLDNIMQSKGAYSVVYYHNNSIPQALCDLFPEIPFSKEKFCRKPPMHEIATRRKVFETYALDNEFDPLNVEKWYSQSFEKIMTVKGMAKVISYHNNSIPKALSDLFPSIAIEQHKFSSSGLWRSIQSRRRFFMQFARDHHFDHDVPDNWYRQNIQEISSTMGAGAVLSYHNNSMAKALVDLFPGIGLDKSKLNSLWRTPKLVSQLV